LLTAADFEQEQQYSLGRGRHVRLGFDRETRILRVETDRTLVIEITPLGTKVVFGDGKHGRIPPVGRRVRVPHYRYRAGGGRSADVPLADFVDRVRMRICFRTLLGRRCRAAVIDLSS
jgi:hypothetical protein